MKEPRTHSYLSSVMSAVLMIKEIKEESCGVTIDFGHGFEGYENRAESVAILKKYGNKLEKLFECGDAIDISKMLREYIFSSYNGKT